MFADVLYVLPRKPTKCSTSGDGPGTLTNMADKTQHQFQTSRAHCEL